MRLQVYEPPDAQILWRISTFGRHTVPAGRIYWWDNRQRDMPGLLIVQAVLAGRIQFHDAHGSRDVGPGDLLVFTHGEESAYGFREPLPQTYTCQWIGIRGAGVLEHASAFRKRHGSIWHIGLDAPLLAEMDHLIELADPQAATPLVDQALASHRFIIRLFDDAERGRLQRLSAVEQAVEHVLRQPLSPMSLEQVAARYGCSREHLSRTFQQRVGQSPGVYLARARCNRALRLLRDTDLPIEAIAQQAGYGTAQTLARHIRQSTGRSPTQVRRQHRHDRRSG